MTRPDDWPLRSKRVSRGPRAITKPATRKPLAITKLKTSSGSDSSGISLALSWRLGRP
jgi:hypothetical protein